MKYQIGDKFTLANIPCPVYLIGRSGKVYLDELFNQSLSSELSLSYFTSHSNFASIDKLGEQYEAI